MGDLTMCHARSPRALDAIGRGMITKPHPLEIRIPDCLCSFAGNRHLFKAPPEKRPLRGRGRGGQLPKTSSRDRLIRRTLDSKKMDVKEGKGFILEKFLGQQTKSFNVKGSSAYSQSSGYSRRTCPPNLKANAHDWPDLGDVCNGGGTGSLSNERKSESWSHGKKGVKAGGNHKSGDRDSEHTHRSCSEENLNTDPSRDAVDKNTVELEGKGISNITKDEKKVKDPIANQDFTKPNVGTTDPGSGDHTEGVVDEEIAALEAAIEHYLQEEECEEPALKVTETKDGHEGGEVCKLSLSSLAKEITSGITNQIREEGVTEIFDEESEEPSQTEKSVEEKPSDSMHTEDEEVNYRLLGEQEEYLPGDILPLTGPNVLQIEGLPEKIKNEDVSDLFLSCGTVTACKVLRDADTKLCIGIAYVRLKEESACAMAMSSFNEETSPFTEYYEDDEIPILKVHQSISQAEA